MNSTGDMIKELRYMIKARTTLLWVVTGEERRAERAIVQAGAKEGYHARLWDCANGVVDAEGGKPTDIPQADGDPPDTFHMVPLTMIKNKTGERQIWILRDFHKWLEDPHAERALRSLARDLQDAVNSAEYKVVVVLSPSAEVPATLVGSVTVLDWPLPDREEIERFVTDLCKASGVTLDVPKAEIADAGAGMEAEDIATACSRSLVEHGRIVPALVAHEKKRVIDRARVLTWYEPDKRGLDAVGGLDLLKRWLVERHLAMSPQAQAYGLPPSKGVFIVGVPGCGKSLVAKTVPTALGIPLLRMDLGALKGSLVGQSEGNIRKALKIAEVVSPVVLWLDEIEKGMAGAQGYAGDSGVSADQLGYILTWLQERRGSVFVVATANDVSALPPELSRKGRFDEIFFVDLPQHSEREQILAAALLEHGRAPKDFDLPKVAAKTDSFSGAEVAALVPSAMFRSYADGQRKLRTGDLLQVAEETIPMSQSAQERIGQLRKWASTRARWASTRPGGAATKDLAPLLAETNEFGSRRVVQIGKD